MGTRHAPVAARGLDHGGDFGGFAEGLDGDPRDRAQIRGLAGRVSEKVEAAGWKVGATDNWYGTVPATTVYFPKGKKAVAQQLALDLGIARVLPADTDSDMSDTNLTVILTGELD